MFERPGKILEALVCARIDADTSQWGTGQKDLQGP